MKTEIWVSAKIDGKVGILNPADGEDLLIEY